MEIFQEAKSLGKYLPQIYDYYLHDWWGNIQFEAGSNGPTQYKKAKNPTLANHNDRFISSHACSLRW